MAVRPTKRLTYADLAAFPDDGLRRELIDGELYVSPSPNRRHQRIAGDLFGHLWTHVRAHGGGEVIVGPFDVLFADSDVVAPDIVFVADADRDVLTDANVRGVPTLVVEVISKRSYDLRKKLRLYERYGVREYRAFDPKTDEAHIFRLTDDGYGEPEILRPGDTLTTRYLPGLGIDLDELFRR